MRPSRVGGLYTLWRESLQTLAQGCCHAAVDLLFPPHCVFCGEDLAAGHGDALICGTCRMLLVPPTSTVCPRCAIPLPDTQGPTEKCPRCQDEEFCFDCVDALGIYHGQLREAIVRMKHSVHEPLIIAMGTLLAPKILARLPQSMPDVIVPVPIHRARRMSRGFNQAELLADSVAKKVRLPVLSDLMVCRRKIRKQGTLGAAERSVNVRGAFTVSSDYDISDARILVLDDVMTTGATLNEIAKACRRAGAASISAAVVARAVAVH